MNTPVQITSLQVENVKRVRAFAMKVEGNALTVIGGNNGQGKTSILDAIMWTLGGDRYKPTTPLREGAEKLATKVTLNNGITVDRRGVNGSLTVTDATGKKAGQQLLNEFVSTFALDLPKFMVATEAEKAQMLLECFPNLGSQLVALNAEAKRLYEERTVVGRDAERKRKYAQELPHHEGVPDAPLTGSEMTKHLQDALAKNGENDRLRREVGSIRIQRDGKASEVQRLREQLKAAEDALEALNSKLFAAIAVADAVKDEDTTAIQAETERIDQINGKVRDNLNKARANDEADELTAQYNDLTERLESVRQKRIALLASVDMPLPGLEINEDGQLTYRKQRWDGMSGAEQMRVAVAICHAFKPACGFVLLDGLERMDALQLGEFSQWLAERGLQAIGTRVGTGDECSIVIEDGQAVETIKTEPITF